jgi:hypothetical protein
VAHLEFNECSGRSGVNFVWERRVAPQSHGSKPMLPAAILDLLAYVFSKRVVVQLTTEMLYRFDDRPRAQSELISWAVAVHVHKLNQGVGQLFARR